MRDQESGVEVRIGLGLACCSSLRSNCSLSSELLGPHRRAWWSAPGSCLVGLLWHPRDLLLQLSSWAAAAVVARREEGGWVGGGAKQRRKRACPGTPAMPPSGAPLECTAPPPPRSGTVRSPAQPSPAQPSFCTGPFTLLVLRASPYARPCCSHRLDIIDDSYKHAGHGGFRGNAGYSGETHFIIEVRL